MIFLGDSITKNWMQQGPPDLGCSLRASACPGYRHRWRYDAPDALANRTRCTRRVQPKVVVLMIGVNNVNARAATAEEIAKGIQEILGRIEAKLPQTKILLLSVLPVGNPSLNPEVRKVNALLPKLAGGKVRFLDLTSLFETPDGKLILENYKPDQLHLLEPGYTAIDKVLHPVLLEMLKTS